MTLVEVLQAKDATEPAVVGSRLRSTVRQALRLMSLHDVSQLPVMDRDRCIGSISDWSLSAKSLADPKMLDATVSDVMDAPFPTVDSNRSADSVVKLLSKASPAVLVTDPDGTTVRGIVTRSDLLHFLMAQILTGCASPFCWAGRPPSGTCHSRVGSGSSTALRSTGHVVTAVDPVTRSTAVVGRARVPRCRCAAAPPSLEELARLSGARRARSVRRFCSASDCEADVVFLGLHGGRGEDGTIQAMLDCAGRSLHGQRRIGECARDGQGSLEDTVPCRGSHDRGLDHGAGSRRGRRAGLGFPVVVKPSKQGSTVGLTVVRERATLQAAITQAFQYDDEVMIERFVPGRELTVGVLGDEALPVGEIFPEHDVYDYECKYTAGMAREEFPAQLELHVRRRCCRTRHCAHSRALKLRGYARIDFRLARRRAFRTASRRTLCRG